MLQVAAGLPITTVSAAVDALGNGAIATGGPAGRCTSMIRVTRLDGTPMIVNADQITWVEFMPDTVISLANGEKLIVREPPEAIVERVRDFKRFVLYGGRRTVRGPVAVALAGGERR